MLETNVPERFRDLRETRDMTQSDLADVADMKQSAISRFESQRVANWKLETLLKLADALDAQLEISIVPAEEVIARHEREEAGGSSGPKSLLEAVPDQNRAPNQPDKSIRVDTGSLVTVDPERKATTEPDEDEQDNKQTALLAALAAAKKRRNRGLGGRSVG